MAEPSTMEAQVQTQAIAYGICGGKSGRGFSPNTLFFHYHYHSTNIHVHIAFIYHQSCIIIAIESIIKKHT